MVDSKIKKTLPHQKVSNTTEDLRVVALAKFREENTDCLHTLTLQGTGDHAGLVIKFLSGRLNPLTGRIRNGAAGRIIQDIGYCGWTEVQILG
jgi:hypothetical protein